MKLTRRFIFASLLAAPLVIKTTSSINKDQYDIPILPKPGGSWSGEVTVSDHDVVKFKNGIIVSYRQY